MDALGGLMMIVGGAMTVIAWIWVVVIAFREDGFLWGIGSLLIGLVALIYMLMHFDECRTPFWLTVAGIILAVIGIMISPEMADEMAA